MKKLLFSFCIAILVLSNANIGNCAGVLIQEKDKPTIVLAFAGCLNKLEFWDIEAIKIIKQRSEKTFSPNYKLYISEQYKKPYNAVNSSDIASLHVSDTIELFKLFHPDYIIIYEFLPFKGKTSRLHLKIIDVLQNQYIADKTFNYISTWASIKGHYNEIYLKVESEVFSEHFSNLTPTLRRPSLSESND